MTEKEYKDFLRLVALQRKLHTASNEMSSIDYYALYNLLRQYNSNLADDDMSILNIAAWVVSYCDSVEKLLEVISVLNTITGMYDQIQKDLEK